MFLVYVTVYNVNIENYNCPSLPAPSHECISECAEVPYLRILLSVPVFTHVAGVLI